MRWNRILGHYVMKIQRNYGDVPPTDFAGHDVYLSLGELGHFQNKHRTLEHFKEKLLALEISAPPAYFDELEQDQFRSLFQGSQPEGFHGHSVQILHKPDGTFAIRGE